MKKKFSAILSWTLVYVLAFGTVALPTQAAELPQSYTSPNGDVITVEEITLPEGVYSSQIRYRGDGVFSYQDGRELDDDTILIDKDGNELARLKVGAIGGGDNFHEGLCLTMVAVPGEHRYLYGYLDKYGEVVIPYQFDTASSFSDGMAAVCKDELWGYIDKSGVLVIPYQFYSHMAFNEGYTVAGSQGGGDQNTYIIDKEGNIVWTSPTYTTSWGSELPIFEYVSGVYDGMAMMRYVLDDGKYGDYVFVSVDGEITNVPDFVYDYSTIDYVGGERFWLGHALRPALYTFSGEQLTENIYEDYDLHIDEVQYNDDSRFAILDWQGDAFVVDYDGNVVIPQGELTIDKMVGNSVVANGHYLLTFGETPEYIPADEYERPSAWAAADINRAIAAGVIPPEFRGAYTQAATRAEFCALAVGLYETVTGEEITERAEFTDTTDVNVQKMAGLGIVNGMGEGRFEPDSPLTREQAAALLSRLADSIGKPLAASAPSFADNGSISGWAKDAVGQMQASGVMGGVGSNTFDPSGTYTREQSMITMLRMYEIVK